MSFWNRLFGKSNTSQKKILRVRALKGSTCSDFKTNVIATRPAAAKEILLFDADPIGYALY